MRRPCIFIVFVSLFVVLVNYSISAAGLKKWFNQEFLPTARGERTLKINPNRITITTKGKKMIEISSDAAYISVAGVTAKTHQLKLRLAQAGCVYATGGDVMKCAPDIVNRELTKMVEEVAKAEEIENQKEVSNKRCKAARDNAKKNDAIYHDLHNKKKYDILAISEWQSIKLDYPATRVKIINNHIILSSDSLKYIENYPVDAVLIYLDDIGITSINNVDTSGYFVLPFSVMSVKMRINGVESSDNKGAVSVKFDFSSEDVPIVCP